MLIQFLNNQFHDVQAPDGMIQLLSPADHADKIGQFSYSFELVDQAVEFASIAFKSWKKTSQAHRSELLKKFQEHVRNRELDLIGALGREVGKPEWEAKTEIQAVLNKIDITLNESSRLTADFSIDNILPGTQGVCRYKPLGVMAVIGPFNFPAHLPNGHWVPALLMGNTVIFKPSEKTPLTARILTECFLAAGFPPGVFQCLFGEKELSRRLCVHPGIHGVLFTGSYDVGLRLKQDTLPQYWKLLALEMGGKNTSLVWKDADVESALYEVAFSAFVTAGQRCTSTSRVIVHADLIEIFSKGLVKIAEGLKVGHYRDQVFSGPLIDASSVERYLKVLGAAEKEGAIPLIKPERLKTNHPGNYVRPSIHRIMDSSFKSSDRSYYQQTELFAPDLAILETSDLDHAIAIMNSSQYGLAAGVFSGSQDVYEKVSDELEVGTINWNRSTAGASSRLPFGGTRKSGNHFPTALNATVYCSYPQAGLKVSDPKKPVQLPIGFPDF